MADDIEPTAAAELQSSRMPADLTSRVAAPVSSSRNFSNAWCDIGIGVAPQLFQPFAAVAAAHDLIALDALQGSPGSQATTVMLRPELVVRASTQAVAAR